MNPQFWHDKWKNNEIAFHGETVHPLLAKHWYQLNVAKGSRVFLPLCGKTIDISWLLSQGYHVVGAELSELAIQQLFEQLGVKPIITSINTGKHYRADNIDIFVADIFDLTQQQLGHIDAVYDRAAIVALPEKMRKQYSAHIKAITNTAAQLVICFDYDQSQLNGPPFSVNADELHAHYSSGYQLKLIDSVTVEGGLKGKCQAQEMVWLLT